MKTNTHIGIEPVDKVAKGIALVADAVKVTIGPKGKNVLIERLGQPPIITNDGVTIAKSICPSDAKEGLGAELVKNVASSADEVAGDGTTTATILANSIVQQGLKRVKIGANPVFLRRSLEKYGKAVIDFLEDNKLEVNTPELVERVATVSSGSEEMGKLISGIIQEVGKNGNVVLQDGNYETVVDYTKGASIDEGHLSPYLVYDSAKQETVLDKPYILLTNKRVGSINQIHDLIRNIIQEQRDLLIVAEDIEGETLATMIMLKNRGNVTGKIIGIKAPDFSDRRLEILEDLAVYTGATVITSMKNLKLDDVGTDELGTCEKVVIKQGSTVFVGSSASKEDLDKRIEHLKAKLSEAKTDYDKDQLTNRIARLDGGVAIIKVGGYSTAEVIEKKLRLEDSINATKHAMKDGAVVGGGLALWSAANHVKSLRADSEIEVTARSILESALREPLRQIIRNCGTLDMSYVEHNINLGGDGMLSIGWNANTDELEDLLKVGILDPITVTKSAVNNAVALSGLFLTTDAVITLDDNTVIAEPNNGMGGLM